MSALIQALDNINNQENRDNQANRDNKQIGENGHAEYSYSDSLRERVVQFSFQLTRIPQNGSLKPLENVLRGLLTELKDDLDIKKGMSGSSIEMLIMLYKMIGHTRDIVNGKGEYALSYMMIYLWDQYWPVLAHYALYSFVYAPFFSETANGGESREPIPYGSWKDIKYFCTYIKGRGHTAKTSSIMHYAISMLNNQIQMDIEQINSGSTEAITLAGKWAPRETSPKHGWLFEELAIQYFEEYTYTALTESSMNRAVNKAKMDYRRLLVCLNRHLDTVQVKQCAKQWAGISPAAQTSITMFKQKHAFLNETKRGEKRSYDPDRVLCANHFNQYIERIKSGEKSAKGKRISMVDFTKEAIRLNSKPYNNMTAQNQIALLDAQWRDSSTDTDTLKNMIAMVDVSGSMDGDPLHAAIALGIRVAEKSLLGKRVMTFSSKPSWVYLEQCNGFTECVKIVSESQWSMNTNFYRAIDLILSAIVEAKLSAETVKDMTLVIFSDMQIDVADSGFSGDSMSEMIAKKYREAGIDICGEPYKPPHILFWNLRSTSGFPVLSEQENVSALSGFSPALLNTFCEKGLQEMDLESLTPWSTLKSQIDHPRYDHLQNKCMRIIEDIQEIGRASFWDDSDNLW